MNLPRFLAPLLFALGACTGSPGLEDAWQVGIQPLNDDGTRGEDPLFGNNLVLSFFTPIDGRTPGSFFINNASDNSETYLISEAVPQEGCPENPFVLPYRQLNIPAYTTAEVTVEHRPTVFPPNNVCRARVKISLVGAVSTSTQAVILEGEVQDSDLDEDGFYLSQGDCDDRDPAIHPHRIERCNGVDDDCDGRVDDDDPEDGDDGHPSYDDKIAAGDDTDVDPATQQGDILLPDPRGRYAWFRDLDLDGFPDEAGGPTWACGRPDEFSRPAPGFPGAASLPAGPDPTLNNGGWDCDDRTAFANPLSRDAVNTGTDLDCDGFVLCYADQDGDGYGDERVPLVPVDVTSPSRLCVPVDDGVNPPPAVGRLAGDCDDTAAVVNPGAAEVCALAGQPIVDEDCNGRADDSDTNTTPSSKTLWFLDADGDGYGTTEANPLLLCVRPDSYTPNTTDCDDTSPNARPGGTLDPDTLVETGAAPAEVCDSLDNNCDNQIDNASQQEILDQANAIAAAQSQADADTFLATVTYFPDRDFDGFGDRDVAETFSCRPIQGFALTGTDCNDRNAQIRPFIIDPPADGVDQNCDDIELCYPDDDQDGFGNGTSALAAVDALGGVPPGRRNLCDGNTGDVGTPGSPVLVQTSDRPGDCNNADPAINPAAAEACNGLDDNCNNLTDDVDPNSPGSLAQNWYRDLDGDGFGAGNPVAACSDPGANQTPPVAYVLYGTDVNGQPVLDVNGNPVLDCDDTNRQVSPGQQFDIPADGVDQDCDGEELCYVDGDGDGDGVETAATVGVVILQFGADCTRAPGASPNSTDCNDGNRAINLRATEVCDGIDNDCDDEIDDADQDRITTEVWYRDADNDGEGTPALRVSTCVRPAGYVANSTDCNDASAAIGLTADEVCDRLDNNCNGLIDDEDASNIQYAGSDPWWLEDADGDRFGIPELAALDPRGIQRCANPYANGRGVRTTTPPAPVDCDDTRETVYPGALEIVADGLDNNCNGSDACYPDGDGDGWGVAPAADAAPPAASGTLPCQTAGYTSAEGDCDDSRNTVRPNGVEECNGRDDDCDGLSDDDDPSRRLPTVLAGQPDPYRFWRDLDGDAYGDRLVTVRACVTPADFTTAQENGGNAPDCNDSDDAIHPGAAELTTAAVPPDGIDQNCDGAEACYNDGDRDRFGTTTVITGARGDLTCSRTGYSANASDCDDTRISYNPAAPELCAAGDEDCDGLQGDADLSVSDQALWFRDFDGDGDGDETALLNPNNTRLACVQPAGFAATADDCNDSDNAINRSAFEVCDGGAQIDENCNGRANDQDLASFQPGYTGFTSYYGDLDGDGYGAAGSSPRLGCDPRPREAINDDDCIDAINAINPGALESAADGIDQNCDRRELCFEDADLDGVGGRNTILGALNDLTCAGSGVDLRNTDCDDNNAALQSGNQAWYPDGDGDGFGVEAGVQFFCNAPLGSWSNVARDCNDGNAAINPNATENCTDNVDNDCNGLVNENTVTRWIDRDADTYGDPALAISFCPDGPNNPLYIAPTVPDCNDLIPTVNPGVASDTCNGRDDDCDGAVDENASFSSWWRDDDADGIGTDASQVSACSRPAGYVTPQPPASPDDCDDTDPRRFPGNPEVCDGIDNDCDSGTSDPTIPWYRDADGDGARNTAVILSACTQPPGYLPATAATDCDDGTALRAPTNTEVCDGIDNDCNAATLDPTTNWYRDADGDGARNVTAVIAACAQPSGYLPATAATDCDDGESRRAPDLTEVCDGLDNDCNAATPDPTTAWYRDADGDGARNVNVSINACTQPPGYVGGAAATDCDDGESRRAPGLPEICDGLDNDCNAATTETTTTWYRDADGDGARNVAASINACTQPLGYVGVAAATDCDDGTALRAPGRAEVCDGLDNDCDTTIDEGVGTLWWEDTDDDGFGTLPASDVRACSQPDGHVPPSGAVDCDDTDDAIHPGAGEACDGLDNDCDDLIDYGAACPADSTWYAADGHAYLYFDRPLPFVEAEDTCEGFGYRLVRLETVGEYDDVRLNAPAGFALSWSTYRGCTPFNNDSWFTASTAGVCTGASVFGGALTAHELSMLDEADEHDPGGNPQPAGGLWTLAGSSVSDKVDAEDPADENTFICEAE